MFELSDFYNYCKRNNVAVIPYMGMPAMGATLRDGVDMAVFLDFSLIQSTRQLKGVCLHEQGHAATGALHKVSSPFETVERSEYRANSWCAQHYLTEEDFRHAFSHTKESCGFSHKICTKTSRPPLKIEFLVMPC